MPLGTPDPKSINSDLMNKQPSGQTSPAAQARESALLMKLFESRMPIVQDPQPTRLPLQANGKSQPYPMDQAPLSESSMPAVQQQSLPEPTDNKEFSTLTSRMSDKQLQILKGFID